MKDCFVEDPRLLTMHGVTPVHVVELVSYSYI